MLGIASGGLPGGDQLLMQARRGGLGRGDQSVRGQHHDIGTLVLGARMVVAQDRDQRLSRCHGGLERAPSTLRGGLPRRQVDQSSVSLPVADAITHAVVGVVGNTERDVRRLRAQRAEQRCHQDR